MGKLILSVLSLSPDWFIIVLLFIDKTMFVSMLVRDSLLHSVLFCSGSFQV